MTRVDKQPLVDARGSAVSEDLIEIRSLKVVRREPLVLAVYGDRVVRPTIDEYVGNYLDPSIPIQGFRLLFANANRPPPPAQQRFRHKPLKQFVHVYEEGGEGKGALCLRHGCTFENEAT